MPESKSYGSQKVTTYYGEAEKQKEFLKKNEERVALNRKLRKEQTPLPRKIQRGMEFVAGGVISGAKRVKESPFVKGALEKVAARSRDIAHEMQESPSKERREHKGKRGKRYPGESYDAPMSFPSMPRDPFGVGGYGGFMSEPRREPPEAPRRRRKRRKTSALAPRQRRSQMYDVMHPGYIPPSMRHLLF